MTLFYHILGQILITYIQELCCEISYVALSRGVVWQSKQVSNDRYETMSSTTLEEWSNYLGR